MKNQICLILLMLTSVYSFSQTESQFSPSQSTFESVIQVFDSMQMNDTNQDQSKYKHFDRYKWFWEPRLGNDADEFLAANAAVELQFRKKDLGCSDENKAWEFIGLDGPGTDEGTDGRGVGRIISIAVDHSDQTGNTVLIGANNGGLWKTTNYKAAIPNWVNITDNAGIPGLGVNSIAIDPNNSNIIYIATGFEYTFTEGTKYGFGLLKTTDGGVSWNKTGLTYNIQNPNSVVVTRKVVIQPTTGHLFVLAQNQIHKSTNGGVTFSQIYQNTGPFFRDLIFLPSNTSTIFATQDGYGTTLAKIIKSTDGGVNWSDITSFVKTNFDDPNFTTTRIDLASAPSNSQIIYACFTNGHRDGNVVISKYNSTTDTWTNQSEVGTETGIHYNRIACSPHDEDVIYLAGVNMFKSINGGASFSLISEWSNSPSYYLHADHRDILVQSAGNNEDLVISCNDGGIGETILNYDEDDKNQISWVDKSGQGLNVREIYEIAISEDATVIESATQDLGFYERKNRLWTNHTGGDGYRLVYDKNSNPPRFYYKGAFQVAGLQYWEESYSQNNLVIRESSLTYATNKDRLEDWQQLKYDGQSNMIVRGNKTYIAGFKIEDVSPNSTIVWDKTRTAVYSIDSDAELFKRVSLLPIATPLRNMALGSSEFDSDYLYSGIQERHWGSYANHLYVCTNATASSPTFQDITANAIIGDFAIKDIIVHPYDGEKVWVCYGSNFGETSTIPANHRVYYSSDAGLNWDVLSDGLEYDDGTPMPFPINSLEYDQELGILYAGTDVGVYYNSDPTNINSTWHCYSKDLPVAIVSDLKIDYCNGKLMAATYGRGLWQCDLYREDMTIASNTIWDESAPIEVYQDIVIPSGYKLTIKSEVQMQADRKIIIEKGGELLVDGGKITNMCSGHWAGIYVEGDITLSQTSFLNQGHLTLSNNAILEHASTAVRLYGLDANGNDDNSKTGGIVIATDAEFKDNWRDISFAGYHNMTGGPTPAKNQSKFVNCEFKTTNEYRKDHIEDIWPNVTMWSVDWIDFSSCTFIDERTYVSGVTPVEIDDRLNRRDGIYSLEASYRINRLYSTNPFDVLNPSAGKATEFIDLRYGIQSINMGNANSLPISIIDSKFECLGGILHSGVEGAIINRNVLNIDGYTKYPSQPANLRDIDAYGIYIDDCSGYQLEGNDFESNWSTDPLQNLAVGIVTNLNRERDNTVYRNTFDDMLLGTEAIGWNRDDTSNFPGLGLKYRCNNFAPNLDNDMDMWVTHHNTISYTLQQTGVPQQGTLSLPASNLFGVYGSSGPRHITNQPSSASLFKYYHHDQSIISRSEPYLKVNVSNVPSFVSQRNCLDLTSLGSEIVLGELDDIDAQRQLMIIKKGHIKFYFDQENTFNFIDGIVNANPSTVTQLLVDLTSQSPFVSIGVLQELAQSYYPFTQENIRDILLLNPHSGRSQILLDTLENRTDSFPASYISQIIANDTTISARDSLYDETYMATTLYEQGLNSVLRKVLHGDTDQFAEIIEPLLLASKNPHYRYKLAHLYDERGDYSKADTLLSSIPTNLVLSTSQLEYHTDLVNLRNLFTIWRDSSFDLSALDSSKIAQLNNYASKTSGIENKVIPILALNNATSYFPPIYNPNEVPPSGSFSLQTEVQSVRSKDYETSTLERRGDKLIENRLNLYPNPTHKVVNIDYQIQNEYTNANLSIIDLNGKLVEKIDFQSRIGNISVDVSAYRNGAYISKLIVDGEVLIISKFVVAR